jgi:hypothetical protein
LSRSTLSPYDFLFLFFFWVFTSHSFLMTLHFYFFSSHSVWISPWKISSHFLNFSNLEENETTQIFLWKESKLEGEGWLMDVRDSPPSC